MSEIHKTLWEEQKYILGETEETLGTFVTEKQLAQRLKMLFDIRKEYLGSDKPVNKIIPLVSVCIPAYQHKNYIEDCLNGALMQQTTFCYEIIVCDDGSTDGTTDICRTYAEKYQDKIRLYDHNRAMTRLFDSNGNAKSGHNWWWSLESAKGKYIALCEGDDYWTDPYKLQKQVDFLENNPDYSLCSHRYKIYDEGKKTWSVGSGNSLFKKGIEGIEFDNKLNFTRYWLTQTMTIVYRKEAFDPLLLSKYKYRCDAHLYYHILKLGKGYCMNYDAAVYRHHVGGIYSQTGIAKHIMHNYNIYNELYNHNQDDDILKFKAIRITIFEHLFNKRYSIGLAKDIIFVIKMTFHYAGLKKGIITLLNLTILLFRIKLLYNINWD
jgi:glycosyltransferase involved in cell wall biosynthesis